MFTRSVFWIGVLLLSATCIFSSCQSSKVAYGNKHYFKQQPRVAQQQPTLQPSEVPDKLESLSLADEELLASIKPELEQYKSTEKLMADATQKLTKKLHKSGNSQLAERIEGISDLAVSAKDESLTRRESKNKRKEIRREIRSLAKDLKASPNSETIFDDLDPYLRKAILFWILGLILTILAVALSGAGGVGVIFSILSGISWLVGSIFFILWLVEELD
ncbi:MAG: hypothetical protein WBA23_01760 [Tunicatimonas sp.]|uniref:hypothetical protein n=1 Tax=Tunicatimonas sp. TaxID=1940096 RepID=UPI003C72796A